LEIEYANNFDLITTDLGFELQILDPVTKEIETRIEISKDKGKKIISLSSTLNGMLSILNQADNLVGISDINYVNDPKIHSLFNANKITEYGDETNFSLEKVIASNANIILYSGFGKEFPHHAKLKALNIDIIPIYDWRENHPLGKAEWIKVVGAIVGKEKEALEFYEDVKRKYFEIKGLAENSQNKPSTICGNLIGDIWYTPGGDGYYARLLKDAGATYKYAEIPGTSSLQFSIETILTDNKDTEFWINPGIETREKIDRINPHAKHLKAYQNIYCYSPNLNKFWERSAAEPHLVLSDLIHIFHPEIKTISTLHFYDRIK
jgi:iron complex transport system substrate-binding protein